MSLNAPVSENTDFSQLNLSLSTCRALCFNDTHVYRFQNAFDAIHAYKKFSIFSLSYVFYRCYD